LPVAAEVVTAATEAMEEDKAVAREVMVAGEVFSFRSLRRR